jgi:hypothetical protein
MIKFNPTVKVGDHINVATMPDAFSVTPVADDTGKIIGVFVSLALLRKWNEEGCTKGAFDNVLAELEKSCT